ncbi:MAG: NAD-dependent epimerase/dehydratase family protein, partial [Pirellulaceae bacterium]|nr:NAD-dependent epimerase/dehydratase family protein [Pirellulaceae bacterium]
MQNQDGLKDALIWVQEIGYLEMARVLVAGANGFIGRHLVRHLVEFNHDVVCLVRNKPKRLRFGDYATGCVIGDVTDLASLRPAIKNCDLVINLAGVTKSLSRRELFAVNEKGAANVADVCAERTSPPILIHVSSLSAAGTQPNWRIADTNPADEPVSIYGKSKLAGEFALRRYAGQVPISILRPTIVFGEGDRDVLPLFQSIHYYGWAFLPPFARQRFSFIHAADLSQAIRLVALKGERLSEGKAAGTYYAADPNALRFDEFAKAIGNCLKRNRTRTLVSPRWLMALLGGLCSIGS